MKKPVYLFVSSLLACALFTGCMARTNAYTSALSSPCAAAFAYAANGPAGRPSHGQTLRPGFIFLSDITEKTDHAITDRMGKTASVTHAAAAMPHGVSGPAAVQKNARMQTQGGFRPRGCLKNRKRRLFLQTAGPAALKIHGSGQGFPRFSPCSRALFAKHAAIPLFSNRPARDILKAYQPQQLTSYLLYIFAVVLAALAFPAADQLIKRLQKNRVFFLPRKK